MNVKKLRNEDLQENWIAEIAAALKEIKFGAVEIIIHNGRIVQIEKKEKIRLNQENSFP